MSDEPTTCGDFGGVTQDGEPCGHHSNDGKCYHHRSAKSAQARLRFDRDDIVDALYETSGVVLDVAKKLGCDRNTVYDYIERFDLQDDLEQARRGMVDIAENSLIANVRDQNQRAVEYVLDTHGAYRGYGKPKRIDVTSDGEQVAAPVILPANGHEPDDE